MITHRKKEYIAFSNDKILLQHWPLLTSDSLQWPSGLLSAMLFAPLHQHLRVPKGFSELRRLQKVPLRCNLCRAQKWIVCSRLLSTAELVPLGILNLEISFQRHWYCGIKWSSLLHMGEKSSSEYTNIKTLTPCHVSINFQLPLFDQYLSTWVLIFWHS